MRPWSYSRLSTYEDCPKQFWYSYVENMPSFRPPSPSADRGTKIHKEGEDYLLGKVHIYPPSYQKVATHMMGLKVKSAMPEMKMAVNEKWEAVDYKAPDAYFRAIIDVHYVDEEAKILHVQDFKTGQVYSEHAKQMSDYVPIAAAHYPECTEVHTRLIYVDQGIVTPPKVIEVGKIKGIKIMLEGRIKNAEEDTIWPATPSIDACRFCNYHRKHGGPCQVGR